MDRKAGRDKKQKDGRLCSGHRVFPVKILNVKGLLWVMKTKPQRDQGLREDGVHLLGHEADGWGTDLGGRSY